MNVSGTNGRSVVGAKNKIHFRDQKLRRQIEGLLAKYEIHLYKNERSLVGIMRLLASKGDHTLQGIIEERTVAIDS